MFVPSYSELLLLLELKCFVHNFYCETHRTVNTRNISGMLLCCEELANEAREN